MKVSFKWRFFHDYILGCFRPKLGNTFSKELIFRYFSALEPELYDVEYIAAKDNPFIKALLDSQIIDSKIQNHSIVLDVGCGKSDIVRNIPSLNKANYIGVDINLKFLELAKSSIDHPRFAWVCADVDSLPLQTNTADVVFLINILPYIEDFHKLLNIVQEMMSEDGITILLTAIPSPFWEEEFGGFRILLRPTSNILDSIENFGFHIIESRMVGVQILGWPKRIDINYGFFCVFCNNSSISRP